MVFCTDKDVDRALLELRAQGWRIEDSGGKHLKVYPPDRTKGIVIVSRSPSDWRAAKSIMGDLRRAGANIKGRQVQC